MTSMVMMSSRQRVARFLGRSLLIAAAVGLAPAQVVAQSLVCEPSLDVTIIGGPIFLRNEAVRISADIGAGDVTGGEPDNNFLDIDTFGFLLDCSALDTFPNCTDAGNTVVYANNISTDCTDALGAPVSFNVAQNGNRLDFTTVSGEPIRNDANNTCNVAFDVQVTDIADDNPEATIVQIFGWLDVDARCGWQGPEDPGVAGASAQLSFDISSRNANFRVTKDFSDNNPLGVNVHLDCNTGLILDQDKVIFDQPGNFVNFVVTTFRAGELSCHVTEDPVPAGYQESYVAGTAGGIADSVSADTAGCHFLEVTEGQFTCDITDQLQPLEVTVNKRWLGDFEENGFDRKARASYQCFNVRDGSGLVTLEGKLKFAGDSTRVISDVFPDHAGTTYCVVAEAKVDSAVESDASDCANVPVTAESDRECTLYNTLFFEGIPTLNHYGMAVLAVLMLGVGWVGFRRFI